MAWSVCEAETKLFAVLCGLTNPSKNVILVENYRSDLIDHLLKQIGRHVANYAGLWLRLWILSLMENSSLCLSPLSSE